MKTVVNYLDFAFLVEVKVKSNYRIFEFFFSMSKRLNGTLGTQIEMIWLKLNLLEKKLY